MNTTDLYIYQTKLTLNDDNQAVENQITYQRVYFPYLSPDIRKD